MMKFLLLFLFIGIVRCQDLDEITVTVQDETATDYPPEVMDGDISLVPENFEEPKEEIPILGRQNEVEDEQEGVDVEETAVSIDSVETSSSSWMEEGCTKAHEHWDKCGPRCQMSCTFQTARSSRAICESIFKTGSCFPGCYCDPKYVRFNDECILPVDCPTRACLPNEEYLTQGPVCEVTCDNYEFADEIEAKCPKDIGPIKGCFCKPGYVRTALLNCILPNRCPRHRVS